MVGVGEEGSKKGLERYDEGHLLWGTSAIGSPSRETSGLPMFAGEHKGVPGCNLAPAQLQHSHLLY